jgi:DNA primase large subunit
MKLAFLNNSDWFIAQEANLFTIRMMNDLDTIDKSTNVKDEAARLKNTFYKKILSEFYTQVGYKLLEPEDADYKEYRHQVNQYRKNIYNNNESLEYCEVSSTMEFSASLDGPKPKPLASNNTKNLPSENAGPTLALIVPFEDACRLMADHKVMILHGRGFVEGKDLEKIIKLLFERVMRDDMKLLGKHSEKVLMDDERLASLIEKIPNMYTGKDYSKIDATSTKNKINLAEIDVLASKNFPLCMSEVFFFVVAKFFRCIYI